VPALERPRKRLLREVERKLAACARVDERRHEPRHVAVVERDDRIGVAPQAAQRLGIRERPGHVP
jgi:hypothetical protein